jgi:beta-galactosidase/beta-glucuronidase
MDVDGLNYPRKQFRRDQWVSLNGPWRFCFDDAEKFHSQTDLKAWPLSINVPFAPETSASGIGDTGFHQRCWYERDFEFTPLPGKRLLLHFGAVDYRAQTWLNDQYLGEHEGGHTPFTFDITDSLRASGQQTLCVCAADDPHDLTKPRGKQDWRLEPHSIWYPRTTGIWQTVWLEEVNEIHIERLRCSPLLERWEIGVECFIAGPRFRPMQIVLRLKRGEEVLASDRYEVLHREVHRRIALSDPGIDDFRNELLWSPERPTCLQLELELWCEGEKIDHVHSYTALRSVSVDRGRVLLNGRPYYLRLVLDQGYWPESFMTPPDSSALKRDIELIKACGFNGVRKHQKIEDPDFLYWADQLGLLVWTELPSAYRFTHESVERLTREWLEIIDRDISHPSVMAWVPFNESWGVPDLAEKEAHQNCVQALYHLTKTLDPNRPCIGNDGWESTATDILGIHDYDDQPERMARKYSSDVSITEVLARHGPGGRVLTVDGYAHTDQPVMLTEFGGIACKPESDRSTWGYSQCATPEELHERYSRLLACVHSLDLFSGFCYTQFTDTFQEANGLFFADRRPKFPIEAIQQATTMVPRR